MLIDVNLICSRWVMDLPLLTILNGWWMERRELVVCLMNLMLFLCDVKQSCFCWLLFTSVTTMSTIHYDAMKHRLTDDAEAIAAISILVNFALYQSSVLELDYINNNHLYCFQNNNF
ncbi:hypothetical protein T4C_5650 [Trichinella pseudospiralis]|uniref:Uncharacterized protein n=1 Tax=Trichinella pseudospiralis TaxID=6337 RepID=A0A0V1JQS0_TRIPS|nr:hypothetical protein T4C_5650 [Trichinella pseudospiralis]